MHNDKNKSIIVTPLQRNNISTSKDTVHEPRELEYKIKQERLADGKVRARQQCVYEGS